MVDVIVRLSYRTRPKAKKTIHWWLKNTLKFEYYESEYLHKRQKKWNSRPTYLLSPWLQTSWWETRTAPTFRKLFKTIVVISVRILFYSWIFTRSFRLSCVIQGVVRLLADVQLPAMQINCELNFLRVLCLPDVCIFVERYWNCMEFRESFFWISRFCGCNLSLVFWFFTIFLLVVCPRINCEIESNSTCCVCVYVRLFGSVFCSETA